MPNPENVKTFAANLSKAIRDHEVVRMGGGEFNREELMEVLKALTESGCVVELLPEKAFNTALKLLEAIRASNPELIADNMPPGWGMNKLRDAFSGEVLPGATMSEIKVVDMREIVSGANNPSESDECGWIERHACYVRSNFQGKTSHWEYVVRNDHNFTDFKDLPPKLLPCVIEANLVCVQYLVFRWSQLPPAFTVLCRAANVETTHFETYYAETQDHAVDMARTKASGDWSCEPEDIQILGVLSGVVEALEWNDKIL